MMKDYSKYLNSTGTHYISNSGSDENGGTKGGKAGDQTGKEWQLRSWYSRPWSVVLRYPDPNARLLFAKLSCAAALNNLIGYDQTQRTTYLKQLKASGWNPENITVACEEDCTAGVTANWIAVGNLMGIPALANLNKDTTSRNMLARFKAAGFVALTESKYLTSGKYTLPGDVLLYENHHAAANVTKGKYAVETAPLKLGDRTLKNGMSGEDVREMQMRLIELGYDLGKWGADGDYGDCTELAVREFQKDHGLTEDGKFGKEAFSVMQNSATKEEGIHRFVEIVNGNCYVRTAPNTSGEILGVAKKGSKLEYGANTAENGWHLVSFENQNGWVSNKYSRLMED